METKHYRAGETVDDLCRPCKLVRRHTVMVANPDGTPVRVICDYCGSQHNFRGGAARSRPPMTGSRAAGGTRPTGPTQSESWGLVSERERSHAPMSDSISGGAGPDLELMLRKVIREETGLTAVVPADKWHGGDLVLRPGREGVQEKAIPIETFFHKIVMLRNRLRVMEQQINGAEIPQELKLKLQGYITACYGSLTSFNVLFAEEDDRFKGGGG